MLDPAYNAEGEALRDKPTLSYGFCVYSTEKDMVKDEVASFTGLFVGDEVDGFFLLLKSQPSQTCLECTYDRL